VGGGGGVIGRGRPNKKGRKIIIQKTLLFKPGTIDSGKRNWVGGGPHSVEKKRGEIPPKFFLDIWYT